jgi:hypothetical protein
MFLFKGDSILLLLEFDNIPSTPAVVTSQEHDICPAMTISIIYLKSYKHIAKRVASHYVSELRERIMP